MNRTNHNNRTAKLSKLIFCFSILASLSSPAQKANTFITDCVTPGQNMVIDAVITNADASTYYHWQYKTQSGTWTCFINGINTINGTNFTVSGATGTGANNAPELTIFAATTALENVLVRVAMAHNADPCATPPPDQIWNADNQAMEETKYLRLHVFVNTLACPPNAFSCPGNVLIGSGKFYGGFENTSFNPSTDTYTRNNFGGNNASSDLVFGSGPGSYQDINNPYAMNNSFFRDIAPHSGDYQMVVEGSANNADRVWHKSINVIAGRQYAFSAWVLRVDNSAPVIELRANNNLLVFTDMSFVTKGEWNLVQGTFAANSSTLVNFNIRDGKPGGRNNFSLDDICLRECSNCSILELHQLYLSASLSRDEVKVKWVAENEMGTANFIIERSFDGVNFEKLASKQPSGPVNTPTSYFYNDDIQNIGLYSTLYYRIKAMDTDGRYAYSNVVIIRLGKSASVQAWPNPFMDFVNVTYISSANSKIEISLTNAEGKILKRSSYSVSRGLNQLAINELHPLASGIYFMRIADLNTNQVYMRKITK